MVAADERGERALAVGAQAGRARGGEAGKHGEAERAAHHERRVDDARGESGLLRRDVAHRGEQHRVERRAGTDAEQDHARKHVDEEVPVHRCPHEQREPDGRQQQSDGQRRPDAEAHDELGGEADREEAHDQIRRQESQTDLQRAVPEHELEIESREEEPCEHRGGPQHADDVRRGEVAQPEEAQRHQRRANAGLDREEDREERDRAGEHAEGLT